MKCSQAGALLGFAVSVMGHGFVYQIDVDGTLYPGYYPQQDYFKGYKRIAFSAGGTVAVMNATSPDLACNSWAQAPALIATARAGSNITYNWSPWVPSHKGPMTTYMAPYEGDLAKTNLNKLEFFKTAEEGLSKDGKVWATDRLIDNKGLWTTTIPSDIKPGLYVLRHELLALHFATSNSNWWYIPGGAIAPQFYIHCFNLNVTGTGTQSPKGVTFPGAYAPDTPGLVFDIFKNKTTYPIPGPPLYKEKSPGPALAPNPRSFISATGDPVKDEEYNKTMAHELTMLGIVTGMFNAAGG
ncbi:glycoside hydrolase [Microthyrium microscopicum]|uniref:lytic cellulose monooxygenase (C4-dehydrogenating) n=1 Tax=Microthyrium microscopicum TaxID=703497 RepID=A0A6A6U0Z0_9PEZI|nr:glycoside hydrolase [Microthyrium microscopicum]